MKRVKRLAIAGSLCLLACTCVLLAVTPKFWELLTHEDLVKGRLKGVSLSSDGKLSLAPQYDALFDTGQALVLSLAADSASNVYLGTGHEGRVYKVDAKGSGSLYYTAEEIDVFALACDPAGNLYVGTSPDGKVYKVGPGGKGTEFFDPKDKYIWDLLFDKEGSLYVATGGKGLLYRVDKTGNGKVLLDSDEVHLMTLALDAEGSVLAGSAPNGQVYRISRDGKGFVVLDSPLSEIRRVAVDRIGNVYAVALASGSGLIKESDGPVSTNPRSRTLSSLVDGTTGSEVSMSSEDRTVSTSSSITAILSAAAAQDKSSAKTIIYRLAKDGTFEKIWTSNTDMVFDLWIRDDGRILVGTGTKGRVLAIDPLQSTTILSESGEESVTRLLQQGNDLLAASSNMGKLYRLQPLRSRSGEYESDVFDAGLPSFWGQIRWKGTLAPGTSVEIYTRSGNTSSRNQSWSDWSGPYTNKEGEPVKSPQARYIQWKAVFKSSGGERKLLAGDDTLEGLSIAYLQQNVRPQVSVINVLPAGLALQKQPSLPSGTVVSVGAFSDSPSSLSQSSALSRFKTPPRRVEKAGAQSMSWRASDENDDVLHFALYFKGDSESEWKLLEKELEDDFYTIDSNDLPDGTYTVKVVASDELSNAFGKALQGELVSKPFTINNSAPSIALEKNESRARRVEFSYRAKDSAAGLISSSEFSIDGGPWHLVFPRDGIADSREEEYLVQTPELSAGEHIIGIRVTNFVGCVGAIKLVVKVP